MTGDVTRPPVPQAALDAASNVLIFQWSLDETLSPSRIDELAEAAVSAAFAAVVPEDLFIASDGRQDDYVWRETRGRRFYVARRDDMDDEVWALLAALIPTREEAQ